MSSEPSVTVYHSLFKGGQIRESVAGVVLAPEQGGETSADAVSAVFVADGTLAGVTPKAGDRYRDPRRRWWVVKAAAPTGGGFRLDCAREPQGGE
jgi:hypothetical protein